MESYDFELKRYYQKFDSFKEKNAMVLCSAISQSRIGDGLRFLNYGIITFNDHKNAFPHIEEVEHFTRGRINCIIYDVLNNEYYNKLFIYKTDVKDYDSYGFVLYSTETGKVAHTWCIDQLYDILIQHISQQLESTKILPFYNHYKNKYKALKERDNSKIPSYLEVCELQNKYGNIKWQ